MTSVQFLLTIILLNNFFNIVRVKEMISNFRSFGYYTNSLCQYQRKARVWKTWTLILWCKGLRRPQSLSKRLGTLLKNTNKLHTSSPLSTFFGISICLVIIWVHLTSCNILGSSGVNFKSCKGFSFNWSSNNGAEGGGEGGERFNKKQLASKRRFMLQPHPS